MAWQVSFSPKSQKQLDKISSQARERILLYLYKKVQNMENPRQLGKPLSGDMSGFWRYRVEDYRVICEIIDGELLVLVIKIGHRKEVYH